jgi:hypothetical protein
VLRVNENGRAPFLRGFAWLNWKEGRSDFEVSSKVRFEIHVFKFVSKANFGLKLI